jgi:hypothetical protein
VEQLQETEDEVQDGLEDLLDRTEVSESALLQTDQSTIRRFFKVLGVIFLSIILIMGCVSLGLAIGAFLGFAVAYLGLNFGLISGQAYGMFTLHTFAMGGAMVGGAVSVLACVGTTLTRLTVPQLS